LPNERMEIKLANERIIATKQALVRANTIKYQAEEESLKLELTISLLKALIMCKETSNSN